MLDLEEDHFLSIVGKDSCQSQSMLNLGSKL